MSWLFWILLPYAIISIIHEPMSICFTLICIISFLIIAYIYYSLTHKCRKKKWEKEMEERNKILAEQKEKAERRKAIKKEEEKKRKAIEKKEEKSILSALNKKFNAPVSYMVHYSKKKYVLISEKKSLIMINENIYSFKDIIDYSLKNNTITITVNNLSRPIEQIPLGNNWDALNTLNSLFAIIVTRNNRKEY